MTLIRGRLVASASFVNAFELAERMHYLMREHVPLGERWHIPVVGLGFDEAAKYPVMEPCWMHLVYFMGGYAFALSGDQHPVVMPEKGG